MSIYMDDIKISKKKDSLMNVSKSNYIDDKITYDEVSVITYESRAKKSKRDQYSLSKTSIDLYFDK